MNPVDRVIQIALAEVGYREKASNASLDDPLANAGSGNCTKYARDLAAAGYYNGDKSACPWCEIFTDWVFWKAFGPDGQRIQCQTGDLGAACIYSMQYYQQRGDAIRIPKRVIRSSSMPAAPSATPVLWLRFPKAASPWWRATAPTGCRS